MGICDRRWGLTRFRILLVPSHLSVWANKNLLVIKGSNWCQTKTKCHPLTVLTDIHADGVNVGEVGHGSPHGGTGGPHVVEEEDRHSGEAEHTEPGHTQDVCEEHKLRAQRRHNKTHAHAPMMSIFIFACLITWSDTYCKHSVSKNQVVYIPFHWCSVHRWWSWTRCAAPWLRWLCRSPQPAEWSRTGRKTKRCHRWHTASAVFC